MHRNWTRALSLTGNLARRLALQALVSGTVMVALQAASRMEHTLAGVDWSQLADEDGSFGRSPPVTRSDDAANPGPAVAEPSVPASIANVASATIREARLPVPADRDARSRSPGIAEAVVRTRTDNASRAVPSLAARGAEATSLASETLRFDECHPACESRDPLLLRVAQRELVDADVEDSATSSLGTIAHSSRSDGDDAGRPVQVEPASPTRVGALWNGVLGGWQTARQATGSMVGRIGETVGLVSAER